MPKPLKCLTIALIDILDEYQIALGYLAVVIEGIKEPFIIDGKRLKSLLRKYLKKKISNLQSRLEGAKKKGFLTQSFRRKDFKALAKG